MAIGTAIAGAVVSGVIANAGSKGGSGAGLSAGSAELARVQADIAQKQWAMWEDNYAPIEQALLEQVTGLRRGKEAYEVEVDGGPDYSNPQSRQQKEYYVPGQGMVQNPNYVEPGRKSKTETRYRDTFTKVGEAIGSEADQEAHAGQANADVTQAFDRAKRENEVGLRAAGFNEGDSRFTSADTSIALAEAGSRASATNTARRSRVKEAYDKLYQISGLGRGLIAGSQTGLNSAGSQLGTLGRFQEGQDRLAAGDRANALAPIANAVGDSASNWFSNRNAPSGGSSGGSVGSGSTYNKQAGDWSGYNFKNGGLVKRKGYAGGGKVIDGEFKHVDDGLLSGPGTEKSDSIPINASDGEYVVNAAAVRRIGTDALDRINQMGLEKRAA